MSSLDGHEGKLSQASVLRLRPGSVEWREIDGEIVALEVESSTYLASNRTGAAIWQRLVDGATADQLAGELVTLWNIDRARARSDVDLFLGELEARGVLERICVPPSP
jgi:hypothetical protein